MKIGIVLVVFGVVFSSFSSVASTITAASTSRSDVSAAVGAAAVGDTVYIPPGTSIWTSPVLVTKGITIMGAGTNSTKIVNGQSASQGLENPCFDIKLAADNFVRISAIWFQDQNLNDDSDGIRMGSGSLHETRIRIDHCAFEGFSFGLKNQGSWGVCDHCYFLNNDVLARVSGYNNPSSSSIAGAPWGWDSTNYFVFENIVGIHQAWNDDTYLIDSEYPANYMVRFSDFFENRSTAVVLDGFDMHGENNSSVIPLGICIYSNRWTYSGNLTVNEMRLADIRGGANSLVYSNVVNAIGGYINVRDNPTYGPVTTNNYVWQNWGNGKLMGVSGDDGAAAGRNYFTSAPTVFKQLIYPHPLVSSSESSTPIISISPSSLDFGAVALGSFKDLTFTVQNLGGAVMSGSAVAATPFSVIAGASYNLNPGQSQPITVRYSPTSAQNDNGVASFTGGGGGTRTLTGIGLNSAAKLVVSTTALSFGVVTIGSSKDMEFAVQNMGASTLTGTATVGSPFSILTGGSYSLAGGQTQQVTVRYTPGATGNDSGAITCTGGGGTTVAVNGSGATFQAVLSFNASQGTISSPFVVNSDQTVSQSIETTDPATAGKAVYQFALPAPGNYLVRVETYAPSEDANSLFVNIDSQPTSPGMIWDIPTASAFSMQYVTWRASGGANPQIWALTSGSHQLIIEGREAGVKIRQVTIVSYPSAPKNLQVGP